MCGPGIPFGEYKIEEVISPPGIHKNV